MSYMNQPGIILLREGTDSSQGKAQLVSNINACQASVKNDFEHGTEKRQPVHFLLNPLDCTISSCGHEPRLENNNFADFCHGQRVGQEELSPSIDPWSDTRNTSNDYRPARRMMTHDHVPVQVDNPAAYYDEHSPKNSDQ